MKEHEHKQMRWFMAPIVAYMLLGSALLYCVYQLELLSVRLLGYSSLVELFGFKATPWHDHELWITIFFPLSWPLLTLRALLLLILVVSSMLIESFSTQLLYALKWWWRAFARSARFFQTLLIKAANVVRKTLIVAASAIKSWGRRLASAIRTGLQVVGDWFTDLVIRLRSWLAPVFASLWQAALRPVLLLRALFSRAFRAAYTWLLHGYRVIWRTISTISLWFQEALYIFGRMVLTRMRYGFRWLVLGATTVRKSVGIAGRWLFIRLTEVGGWLVRFGQLLWSALTLAIREIVTVVYRIWQQAMLSLRILWRWLLVPLSWLWLGLLSVNRRLAILATISWRWLKMSLDGIWRLLVGFWRLLRAQATWLWGSLLGAYRWLMILTLRCWQLLSLGLDGVWRWLLVPARLLQSVFVDLFLKALHFLRHIWYSLSRGIRWVAVQLTDLWWAMALTLEKIWLWITRIANAGWLQLWRLLAYVQFKLVFVWTHLQAQARLLWKIVMTIWGHLWAAFSWVWEKLWMILEGGWLVTSRIVVLVGGWLLAHWQVMWRHLYLAWSRVKEVGKSVWQWFIRWLQVIRLRVLATLGVIWRRARAALLAASSRIRIAWRETTSWVARNRKRLAASVRSFAIWLKNNWESARIAASETARRLFRASGFWKRVGENLRQARGAVNRSVLAIRASLFDRLRTLRRQLVAAASGSRDQLQAFLHDLRLWLAEIRQQTTDTIRDIIPHG